MRRITFPLRYNVTADDSLYGVKVRGDERPDGAWEPCIEFESRRGIKLETCPPLTLATPEELQEWAAKLDEIYLLDALSKASKGPIRRVRKAKRDGPPTHRNET